MCQQNRDRLNLMKRDKIDELFELCEISKKCFETSKVLEQKEILGWITLIEYSEVILNKTKKGEKLNSYQKKTIEKELLQYWNENLNVEVEHFWKLIEEANLSLKRNPTFENIIAKNRFKNVEQAIDVYNDIYSQPITNLENEKLRQKLEKLYEVVRIDRDKRIKQFRKWIKNKRVSFSDRLKFGENYAYLKRTGLFDEILNQKDKAIVENLTKR